MYMYEVPSYSLDLVTYLSTEGNMMNDCTQHVLA